MDYRASFSGLTRIHLGCDDTGVFTRKCWSRQVGTAVSGRRDCRPATLTSRRVVRQINELFVLDRARNGVMMRRILLALAALAVLGLTVGSSLADHGRAGAAALPPENPSMYCFHTNGPGSPLMCTAP